MDRRPVARPAAPAYPDRRRARLILGLLALGGAGLSAVELGACRKVAPDAAVHPGGMRCSGDVAAPDPAASGPGAEGSAPAAIPEVTPAPATDPVPQPAIRGDMPAVDGDVVEPVEHLDGEPPAPAEEEKAE